MMRGFDDLVNTWPIEPRDDLPAFGFGVGGQGALRYTRWMISIGFS
jgi:hypothetical protein